MTEIVGGPNIIDINRLRKSAASTLLINMNRQTPRQRFICGSGGRVDLVFVVRVVVVIIVVVGVVVVVVSTSCQRVAKILSRPGGYASSNALGPSWLRR